MLIVTALNTILKELQKLLFMWKSTVGEDS